MLLQFTSAIRQPGEPARNFPQPFQSDLADNRRELTAPSTRGHTWSSTSTGSADTVVTPTKRAVARRVALLRSRFPHVHIAAKPDRIVIQKSTASGFDIAVLTDSGRCTLVLGSWFDDFYCVDSAFDLVEAAIRGTLRLRVYRVGSRIHTTSVEVRTNSASWIEIGAMCPVRLFWHGPRRVDYFRNTAPMAAASAQ